MSKTSQRQTTAASLRQKRIQHARYWAKQFKRHGHLPMRYYPHCMAWRWAYLSHGGVRFWGGGDA